MLGYMTIKEARSLGFTHHGKYYGIPLWIGDPDGEFRVATKWMPMEYVMTVFHYIEAFIRPMMFPDDEPSFQFQVGHPI